MADESSLGIPPHEIDRRMRELERLYELGMALEKVRIPDEEILDLIREQRGTDELGRKGSKPPQSSV
jgi:hypothetical protein